MLTVGGPSGQTSCQTQTQKLVCTTNPLKDHLHPTKALDCTPKCSALRDTGKNEQSRWKDLIQEDFFYQSLQHTFTNWKVKRGYGEWNEREKGMNLRRAVESVKPKWMERVPVGERSRAATIRRKEKNGRDKYKRQFTEPRLWEKTYLNSSRLPLFFNVFLYGLVGRHWVVNGLDRGTVGRFIKDLRDENNKQKEKGRGKKGRKKRRGKDRKNVKEKGKQINVC